MIKVSSGNRINSYSMNSLRRRANARNISLPIFLRWLICAIDFLLIIHMIGDLVSNETVYCVGGKVKH